MRSANSRKFYGIALGSTTLVPSQGEVIATQDVTTVTDANVTVGVLDATNTNVKSAFKTDAGGTGKPGIVLGSGSTAADVVLYRDSANTLKTTDTLEAAVFQGTSGVATSFPQIQTALDLKVDSTDFAEAEGDIDDLEALTAGHTTSISSNTSAINAAATILSAIVDLDETNDIMTFGNDSVDYNKVVVRNDRGQVDITSTDIGGTNPAINEINIFNNKEWRKTYAFGSAANVSENGTRTPIVDYLAYDDGYEYACKIRMDRVRAQGWPSSSEDAFADIYAQVIAGSMSISSYNGVIAAGVPSQWSQDVADILYLDATDDLAYFSSTIGLNAIKISTDRTANGLERYSGGGWIGVNASYSGAGSNRFVQDLKCQNLDLPAGKVAGIQFGTGGHAMQVVSQATAQSHGTPLEGGTNVTYGPYVDHGGTTWATPSDERLKTITGDIKNSLDIINKINPVLAYYNSVNDKKDFPVYIAQNIKEVLPNSVSEDDQGMLGVNYESIAVVNTQAIKELHQEYLKLQSEFSKYKIDKEAEINDIKDGMTLLSERLEKLEKTS